LPPGGAGGEEADDSDGAGPGLSRNPDAANDAAAPQSSAALAGRAGSASLSIAETEATLARESGGGEAVAAGQSVLARKLSATGPKGVRFLDIAPPPAAEATDTVSRPAAATILQSGSGEETPPDVALDTLGDPVQTAAAAADPFDFTGSWNDLLAEARATCDEFVYAAAGTGRAYWLTGAALLVVAAELVRMRQEKAAKHRPAAGWLDVTAPSGLA
jgi:hypothetical protein